MGVSPGEESLTAPLRLGDRGAAGLWPDQSQERRHGLACQTASHGDSWRAFSGTDKTANGKIEEREALARNKKGSRRRDRGHAASTFATSAVRDAVTAPSRRR